MAYALSHAVHLLNPAAIVLGGGVALLGEALRARVAAALSSFLMTAFQPGPSVRLAELMEDAVLVGSLAVVRQNLSKH
jgi:glucokinase